MKRITLLDFEINRTKKTNRWLGLLSVCMMFLVGQMGFAQVSLYSFSEATEVYAPITGTTATLTDDDEDDGIQDNISIGFTFNFGGVDYTTFSVSANGLIKLGSVAIGSSNWTNALGNTATHRPLIAACWDDNNLDIGAIVYDTTGSAPNRVLTINFQNTKLGSTGSTNGPSVSYLVRLYETTNVIEMVYDTPFTTTNTVTASVGINDMSSFLSVTPATTSTYSSATANNSINAATIANLAGKKLTFTPPLPCAGTPDAGTISGATVRPACGGSVPSPTTASVTGYSTGVSGLLFQWESSLDDVTWVDAIGTGNATLTYTIPSHTAGQTEYYRLKVTCTVSGEASYSDILQITDPVTPATQASSISTSALGNTTATVTWTNGSGTRRFVKINTTNSFTDPVDGSDVALTASAAYSGSGEQIVYDGTGTSVAVTGLSPVTTYYVRVYEYIRCGSAAPYTYYYNTTTSTDNPGSFTTNLYCTPTGGANNSDEIVNFTLNNLNNTSAPSTGTAGYMDYSSTVTAAEVQIGVPAIASLTSGSGSGNHGAAIWIDYNNDGVFDTDEKVAFLGNTIQPNTTVSFPAFTVPNTVVTGTYRLRVMYRWNASGEIFVPCVAGTEYAETEDYLVEILPAPPCLTPTALTATGITHNQAVLGWTSAGTSFDIELVEAGITPTGTPNYTGQANPFTTPATLTPLTSYEFYVRQDCGGIYSTWTGPFAFSTECLPPALTGTTPGSVCGQGEVTLSATADAGATIAWYTTQTGGTKLGDGATFTTPLISETTSYWVEASEVGGMQNAGKFAPAAAATGFSTNNWGIRLTANEAVTLESVTVYSTVAGTLNVKITDGAGVELYETGNISITGGGVSDPNTISLNYPVTPGDYRILVKSYSGVNLIRESTGLSFPYVGGDGAVSVTSSEWGGSTTSNYYYFYDLQYVGKCSSARTEVVATVTAAPAFALSETVVEICEGETTDLVTITTGASDYDTYVWEPATGVSGNAANGWTFNPTETTAYTLTASQSAGVECVTVVNFTVNVNSVIIIDDIDEEVCVNQVLELNSGISLEPTIIGTGALTTAGNTTAITLGPNPLQTYYGNTKQQWIYTADELLSNGFLPGTTINSFTIELAQANNLALNNLIVKMKNSTTTAFATTSSWESDMTVVKATSTHTSVTGLNTFVLDTPFTWDGNSLVIEINYRNNNSGASTYTTAKYDTTGFASTLFYRVDGATNDVDNYTGAASFLISARNSVSFDTTLPLQSVTWSPATNLYIDGDATVSYTEGTNANVVYFKSENTGVQNFTITVTTTNNCESTAAVEVAVNEAPAISSISASATEVCEGTSVELGVTSTTSLMYSWSDGSTEVGTGATLTVTPITTTTYTVTATNSSGCSVTESVVIMVNEAPQQPVIACYETATFNPVICDWEITGTQPAAPTDLACYETAEFNVITCEWDVIGEQPEEPVLACYETAEFNAVTCEWDVTGEQPEEPVLACYETAEFNVVTCEWDVTGEQPEQPVLECYEIAEFNAVSCEWDITGTAPAAPTADSPQTLSEGQTVADIIVTDVTGTLNWYDDNGTPISDSEVLSEGTYTFWVSQTIDGCESETIEVVVEVTLSTKGFDNASFRAYPNPVKDFFNVSYSKDITNVSVVNMLGQTVITQAVNSTATQIDMTSLPTGNYIVKVAVDGAIQIVKVVKQ